MNGAFRDALFVTGGVRLEHNGGVTTSERYATLPMVGAAFVRDVGSTAVKLRAAYGKGIRPPETTSRATSWMGMRGSAGATELSSEVQSGVEGGLDILLGGIAGLHITRFDQLVSGLIQPVAVSGTTPDQGPGRGGGGGGGGSGPGGRDRIAYVLQNVGEITNRGWELAGSVGAGGLSVSSALSLVESRVRRLATGYRGDLQTGDRMLEVPKRTLSVTTSYSRGPWSTSVTGSRAYDWVNYDRLALSEAFAMAQLSSARCSRSAASRVLARVPRREPPAGEPLVRPSPDVIPRHCRRQPARPSTWRARQRDGASRPDRNRRVAREVLSGCHSERLCPKPANACGRHRLHRSRIRC